MPIVLPFAITPAQEQMIDQFESLLGKSKLLINFIKQQPFYLETSDLNLGIPLDQGILDINRASNGYESAGKRLARLADRWGGEAERVQSEFFKDLEWCSSRLNTGLPIVEEYCDLHNIKNIDNQWVITDTHNESSYSVSSSSNSVSSSSNSKKTSEVSGTAETSLLPDNNNVLTWDCAVNFPGKSFVYDTLSIRPQLRAKIDSNQNWYIGFETDVTFSLNQNNSGTQIENSVTYKNLTLGISLQKNITSSFQVGIKASDFFMEGTSCKAVVEIPLISSIQNLRFTTSAGLRAVKFTYEGNDHTYVNLFKPTIHNAWTVNTKKLDQNQSVNSEFSPFIQNTSEAGASFAGTEIRAQKRIEKVKVEPQVYVSSRETTLEVVEAQPMMEATIVVNPDYPHNFSLV